MFRLYSFPWTTWQSLALLVLRLVVGIAFILHGLPKIQNPMHWMGDKVSPILQLAAKRLQRAVRKEQRLPSEQRLQLSARVLLSLCAFLRR